MNNNLIDVYDIDGTLTDPKVDLWRLVTERLSSDRSEFHRHWTNWQKIIQDIEDPFHHSLEMMQLGIGLLPPGTIGEKVYLTAKNFVLDMIQENQVNQHAIDFIKRQIGRDYQVVLSTANYLEGGKAFADALVEAGWLNQEHRSSITVSGTRVDWDSLSVDHFNMADMKVKGLMTTLQMDEKNIKDRVNFVFADDPLGNDRAILNLSNNSFVIRNHKNESLLANAAWQFISWEQANRTL
jgi:hypothetical protein